MLSKTETTINTIDSQELLGTGISFEESKKAFEEKIKSYAKKLENDRYIYHTYAVIDAINSSHSLFKYSAEVYFKNENLLRTPFGIAFLATELAAFMTLSFLASYLDKNDDANAHVIVKLWPYLRHAIKGLKNAHKGWKNIAKIMELLKVANLDTNPIPIVLGLGVAAVSCRIIHRKIVGKRKIKMDDNGKLYDRMLALTITDDSNLEHWRKEYLGQIKRQSNLERGLGYFIVGLNGIIDGAYLYAGVLSIAVLNPAFFIALLALSSLYVVACVLTRIYEEYNYQMKLRITEMRCELVFLCKELEHYLHQSSAELINDKTTADLIAGIDQKRNQLIKHMTHNVATSFFFSLKNGLLAYGTAVALLFTLNSFIVVPPLAVALILIIGSALLASVAAYMMYHIKKQQQPMVESTNNRFVNLVATIKNQNEPQELVNKDTLKQALHDVLELPKPYKSSVPDQLEVGRSGFSGLAKGKKLITAFRMFAMDSDAAETGPMNVATWIGIGIASGLFSIIWALRAFARGFGDRPEPGKISDVNTASEQSTVVTVQEPAEVMQPTETEIHAQPEALQPEALQPEAPQPEAPQPEVPQPEALQPEALQPEAPQPEVPQPEVPQPEVPQPEVPQPEVPQPEAAQPEAPQPEAPQPEAPQPEPPTTQNTPLDHGGIVNNRTIDLNAAYVSCRNKKYPPLPSVDSRFSYEEGSVLPAPDLHGSPRGGSLFSSPCNFFFNNGDRSSLNQSLRPDLDIGSPINS